VFFDDLFNRARDVSGNPAGPARARRPGDAQPLAGDAQPLAGDAQPLAGDGQPVVAAGTAVCEDR
jgi:hypothetical protein